MPIIIHGDHIEAPLQIFGKMAHVLPCGRGQLAPLEFIHGGLGRLYIVGCTCLYFDETENILVPSNNVDFSRLVRGAVIPRNHNVAQAT